jgi:hypothetical protein
MRRLALFALAVGAAATFTAPATATPACSSVTVTVPGPVIQFGPYCLPDAGGLVLCQTRTVDTGGAKVDVRVCYPKPKG